ncbi:MAG: hypothetical protein DCC67_03725 [Planctomycetota bacterium]|nr:MAG: hypothetical protein DCC67_03725 [Planctomycetota bacterium]
MAASQVNGQQTSGDVQREINRIRHEMDHTLDEIGNYLHPKHLLDYVVDSVRSGSAGASKQRARDIARQGADVIKAHPGPAALLAGAALWYLLERGQEESGGSPYRTGRRGGATYGAWEEGYDWSAAAEDEPTWTEKARRALDDVRAVVADKSMAAKDKIKSVAKQMIGVSGKTREEIHAQWANLREHSGSYVDARTGEPYDESYGDEAWNQLSACACLSDDEADDASWRDSAQETVAAMSESLKNAGASVKEQLRAIGGRLSNLAASGRSAVGGAAGRAASQTRRGMASGYRSAAGGLQSVAHSARHGAQGVGGAVHHSYDRGRDMFSQSLRDEPLVVGAAFLGLGLLAGLIVPATRAENRLMGDAADRVKEQAREAGEQALERGKQAAASAAGSAAEEASRQGLVSAKTEDKIKQAVGQS